MKKIILLALATATSATQLNAMDENSTQKSGDNNRDPQYTLSQQRQIITYEKVAAGALGAGALLAICATIANNPAPYIAGASVSLISAGVLGCATTRARPVWFKE